jgi:hypothetical protein
MAEGKLYLIAGLDTSWHQQQAGQACSGILVTTLTEEGVALHKANSAKQGANNMYLCIDTPSERKQVTFMPASNWIKSNQARLAEYDQSKQGA